MKPRTLSQREKIILASTIGVLAIGIFLNFGAAPLFGKIAVLNQEINKKNYLYQRYVQLMGKEATMSSIYEHYKDSLTPKKNQDQVVAALFEKINESASALNLTITKIKPALVMYQGEYKNVSLEVEIIGPLPALAQLIGNVESLPLFIKVTSFRLSPQPGALGTLHCRATFCQLFF